MCLFCFELVYCFKLISFACDIIFATLYMYYYGAKT